MKKVFVKFASLFFLLFNINCPKAQKPMKSIIKNGMEVNWQYKGDRVFFEMKAPTDGWVAIGFNNSESTTGNYLIMGNVINAKTTVTEHYTLSPGNYKTFNELKVNNSVADIWGTETNKGTILKFSLPIIAVNKYARNLNEGSQYELLIAFSQEDDFQHHSTMRTSVKTSL
jgi:hypothetical protein